MRSARRDGAGVEVAAGDGAPERFDRLILACHPDQALALLADPGDGERAALSRIPYTRNETVVHTGDELLPRRVAARAAWNVALVDCRSHDRPVSVTYSLNRLHAFSDPLEFCVSLNQSALISEQAVIARMTYDHPVYTLDSVAACASLRALARRASHRVRRCVPRLGFPRRRRRERHRRRRAYPRGGDMSTHSALYDAVLEHERYAPAHNAFRYRIYQLLLDLDELDELSADIPFLSPAAATWWR